MTKNTVKLHRVLATSPEKVFKAFSDADAYASWLPRLPFPMRIPSLIS